MLKQFDKPVITVIVMTYNQIKYLGTALDSILEQDIDVPFDILIHDDCSDDGTYELALEYAKRNPHKIRIVHQEERKFLKLGFNEMIFKYVVPLINSEYVAYCDGDDYWTDKRKLYKQFFFMKKNKGCSLCCHNAYVLKRSGDLSSKQYINRKKKILFKDVLNSKPGICIATSSIFVKTSIFKDFEAWRLLFPVEDRPLYINAASKGTIWNLNDTMCVYRQFSEGSWSEKKKNNVTGAISHFTKCIEAANEFDRFTSYKHHKFVEEYKQKCRLNIGLLKEDFCIIFDKNNRKAFHRLSLKRQILLKLKFKVPSLYYKIIKKENNR